MISGKSHRAGRCGALALAVALVLGCAGLAQAAGVKYVFLFIGDGMAPVQRSAAEMYMSAKEGKGFDGAKLAMTGFPVQGMTTTYSANSLITDSAPAATSLASGVKSDNGMVGVTPDGKAVPTIAEIAKKKGYKVGVISTVSIDHATPAAFYAHQKSRNDYYEIGVELTKSDFDFFGGGGFKDPDGKKSKNPQGNLFDMAKAGGYTIAKGKAELTALQKGRKAFAINANLPDDEAMPYDMDNGADDVTLADFTAKGIELLDNPKGFFMMVEGGKIDWACHANDARAAIEDTLAFDDAVKVAMEFAKKHPKETLIVVTGDHETGGLTIGFAGTKYDSYLTLLGGQKVSFQKFSDQVVKGYKEKCGGVFKFDDMKPLITENFGLKFEGDAKADKLVLADYEAAQLQEAFNKSMGGETEKSKDPQTYLLYGGYDPLTVSITHILNQKSGLGWTSYSHTGVPVLTSAMGAGAESFGGFYDNTDIFKKMAKIMGI